MVSSARFIGRPAPQVHRSVRLRQLLRAVFLVEPAIRPELLLGLVEGAGAAERRARDVDLQIHS